MRNAQLALKVLGLRDLLLEGWAPTRLQNFGATGAMPSEGFELLASEAKKTRHH